MYVLLSSLCKISATMNEVIVSRGGLNKARLTNSKIQTLNSICIFFDYMPVAHI